MKLEVKNINGEQTGRSVELPEDIFGITPNDHVVYMAVKTELANKRVGTHSTLERSEVSGTTKKPWKQKGTGGARSGSVKTPLWPGGAITFGPRPHLYKKDMNAKMKVLARKSALAYKAKDQKIVVVEDFHALCTEQPKTKPVYDVLKKLGLYNVAYLKTDNAGTDAEDKKEKPRKSKKINRVLMLVDKATIVKNEKDLKVYDNFKKSCRNIPGMKVSVVNAISTYDIMHADYVLFHESAISNVRNAFGAN